MSTCKEHGLPPILTRLLQSWLQCIVGKQNIFLLLWHVCMRARHLRMYDLRWLRWSEPGLSGIFAPEKNISYKSTPPIRVTEILIVGKNLM